MGTAIGVFCLKNKTQTLGIHLREKFHILRGKYMSWFFSLFREESNNGLNGKNVASFDCKQSAVLACTNDVF